jgi:hypothetical protein
MEKAEKTIAGTLQTKGKMFGLENKQKGKAAKTKERERNPRPACK